MFKKLANVLMFKRCRSRHSFNQLCKFCVTFRSSALFCGRCGKPYVFFRQAFAIKRKWCYNTVIYGAIVAANKKTELWQHSHYHSHSYTFVSYSYIKNLFASIYVLKGNSTPRVTINSPFARKKRPLAERIDAPFSPEEIISFIDVFFLFPIFLGILSSFAFHEIGQTRRETRIYRRSQESPLY